MLERSPKAGAARVRRHRERVRAGELVIPVRIDPWTIMWLVESRYLNSWDQDDRERVREALEAALRVATHYEAG